MEIILKEEIGGKTLSIQTGKVARKGSGSELEASSLGQEIIPTSRPGFAYRH